MRQARQQRSRNKPSCIFIKFFVTSRTEYHFHFPGVRYRSYGVIYHKSQKRNKHCKRDRIYFSTHIYEVSAQGPPRQRALRGVAPCAHAACTAKGSKDEQAEGVHESVVPEASIGEHWPKIRAHGSAPKFQRDDELYYRRGCRTNVGVQRAITRDD